MDFALKNYNFLSGDDTLRVPFVVNVKDSTPAEIDSLLESMTDKLGAKYFRDKGLLMEVLNDQFIAAADPKKFLNGPFIGVFIKENGQIRASTFDMPQGGMTVYSQDQFLSLAEKIEGPLEVPKASSRAVLRV